MKKHEWMFVLVAGIAACALGVSCGMELFLGIKACKLCQIARGIYGAIFGVSVFAIWNKFREMARLLLTILLGGLLLASSYHLMVQYGVLNDPCGVPKGIATMEDFQKMLEAPIPCSAMAAKFLGLPFTAYNLVFSLFFMIIFSIKVAKMRATKLHT